ncbi:MAG TPA: glutamate synthase subunit alpha, partial [Rummeliibacillus sp.]|nr:glutamate synthase subunit alpha [Rummeliibacillus sp.]
KRYGARGLTDDTITLNFTGSAGQSFGAFIPRGMLMHVDGDANDYFGKGLSGGKVVVSSPLRGQSETNVIAGNVCLYGATSGEAYINGRAGERFAVRNSGANVVVEGIGDHGCEYMTGGRVVILGNVGKNFGAGMSGGIAYVLPEDLQEFKAKCNPEMIGFEGVHSKEDEAILHQLLEQHVHYTESTKAKQILNNWTQYVGRFIKVVPTDYKKMLNRINEFEAQGLSEDQATMKAFLANSPKKDLVLSNK